MSVGKGSFFKGWASTQPNIPGFISPGGVKELWLGHVLDVDYNTEIGKVRVRLIGVNKELQDDDIGVYAYPADMNIIKYPIPGELVLVTQGLINYVAKDKYAIVYYYITTLSSNQSITYNSDPYIGQSVTPEQAEELYTEEYEHRFESKISSLNNFVVEGRDGAEVLEKAPLQPFEGDFLLQGRFGATIRLGSTTLEKNFFGTPKPANQWSDNGGAPGNPITIISANKAAGTDAVVEDVNTNNSTIYLCTSQTVPVMISTSKLRSHLYKYDLKGVDGDYFSSDSDRTAFVESPEDEIQYYDESGQSSVEFDLSAVPDVVVGEDLQKIIDQIPDSSLEMVIQPPGTQLLNNGKQPIGELVYLGGQCLVKNAAKAFLAMKKFAEKDGINLRCGSGYRPQFGKEYVHATTNKGTKVTFTPQYALRSQSGRWRNRASYGKTDEEFIMNAPSSYFNPATAPPGRSEHGNGVAADLNTGGRNAFSPLNTQVYVWLIKNSYKFGFVRTVASEEWHYEFKPEKAKKGPYGGIAKATNPTTRNSTKFYSDLQLNNLA